VLAVLNQDWRQAVNDNDKPAAPPVAEGPRPTCDCPTYNEGTGPFQIHRQGCTVASVAEGPAATPPHSFATDAEFQAYTSQLYEQWRNRADATEDFDEWKVAEIKRLTQATIDQYNAGRASALAELDIATRANADAHRMVDVQCAENADLQRQLDEARALTDEKCKWFLKRAEGNK
jgi:hypothetical protein